MARYHYTYVFNGVCIRYLESTAEEDQLDETEDKIAIDFTGNGYLRFRGRCKRAAHRLPKGGRSTITDMYTGDKRRW